MPQRAPKLVQTANSRCRRLSGDLTGGERSTERMRDRSYLRQITAIFPLPKVLKVSQSSLLHLRLREPEHLPTERRRSSVKLCSQKCFKNSNPLFARRGKNMEFLAAEGEKATAEAFCILKTPFKCLLYPGKLFCLYAYRTILLPLDWLKNAK